MANNPVKTDFTGASVTEGGFRTALNNLIDWLLENKLTKASELDAETGTDNTLYMTPLTVWQAIEKYLTNIVTRPANDNSNNAATTAYADRAADRAADSVKKVGDVGMTFNNSELPVNCMYIPGVPIDLLRASYPELHSLMQSIGYPYGAGDGSTSFGMPYMPPNYAPTQAYGYAYGNSDGQVKSHFHTIPNGYQTATGGGPSYGSTTAGLNAGTQTDSTGGSENLAAGMRLLFYIKYK
jgi:hypothetical protein